MLYTKEIGTIGETAAVAKLIKHNISVSIPVGDTKRYDLIFEYKNKLYKAQVKTCEKSKNGVCSFLCQSKKNHTTNKRCTTYVGEIDYFIYYCIELDLLAIVPISIVGLRKNFSLRVNPPKLKRNDVHYFKDFSIEKILK